MSHGNHTPSGRRRLSGHELDLWRQVTRSIKPMRAPLPLAPAMPAPASRIASEPSVSASPQPATPSRQKARPGIPPLAQIEPRLRQRLRRGRTDVDAAIDLHGMRQVEAHHRLRVFIAQAQRDGSRIVLVITGKGRGGEESYESAGVLRRLVPHWLREPDLRPMVIGFEEATATHGGAGALYVRVRRRDSRTDGSGS